VEPFAVHLTVRGYELDPRGHVNQAVYLQYTEHARWLCLEEAGITHDALHDSGVGPVVLEQTIRYFAELRAGDEISVGCEFGWGPGKTFRLEQQIRRPDGGRVAELTGVGGLMDLAARRLIVDPGGRFKALASRPEVLNL
jgi:acyl-CoA thioester hydrolase